MELAEKRTGDIMNTGMLFRHFMDDVYANRIPDYLIPLVDVVGRNPTIIQVHTRASFLDPPFS